LIVGAPLLVLTSVSILGGRPSRPVARAPLVEVRVVSLASLHAGISELRLRAVPTATPAPRVPAAPPARVAAAPVHPATPRPPLPPVSPIGGAAGAQFSLVNQDRAANGAAQLAFSGPLARVAQYRAQDMLNRGYFSHYDPSTGQLAFVQLLHLWGIPYSTAGENIAWSTNPSMAEINSMFMNSPEHRANILKAGYRRIGVGVAGDGAKTMVVEVFSN
jgi:uncharacterized protein YkwD